MYNDFISICSVFFWFSITILSYILNDFTSIAGKTQQRIASQIRSHIVYLRKTYNILVLILYLKYTIFNTI